jgi:hypothetical protein
MYPFVKVSHSHEYVWVNARKEGLSIPYHKVSSLQQGARQIRSGDETPGYASKSRRLNRETVL